MKRFSESRMREIRTSGSMRGERAAPQHLRRRSQRPFRPPEGSSCYDHLDKLGLRYL